MLSNRASNVPSDRPGLLVPRPRTRPELMQLLHEFLATCDVPAHLPDPWAADTRHAELHG